MAVPDLVTVAPGETNTLRIVNCLRLLVQYVQGLTSGGGGNVSYGLTGIGDANYVALTTDVAIAFDVVLTAPRTVTIPAAASCIDGQIILIFDEIGGVTSTNTVTLARTAPDTINSATSIVGISTAFGGLMLIADSVNHKWTALFFSPAVSTIREPAFAATVSILTTDIEVGLSTVTSAVTANLPSALAWSSTNQNGLELKISDRTGNGAAHNITPALNGLDTFRGGVVPKINVNFGILKLRPAGTPVSGWYITGR